MNKKMMIIGAGAALLLGSVALAQTPSSSSTDPNYSANSASSNAANTSATTPGASSTDANAAGSNASATAGERG